MMPPKWRGRNVPQGLRFVNFNGERIGDLGVAETGQHALDRCEAEVERFGCVLQR